jgi:PadR family transcriptional regulator, regulatory protein AphA
MDISNLCLGTLCLTDASGYEIKKMFEESFSHFQAVSFGSIYPALAKLSEQGLVSYREETQEKRPTKKVFSITSEGRRHFFDKLMQTEPAEQYRSDFMVLMMFAHLLPPQRLEEVMQTQIGQVSAELEILKDISEGCCELTPGMRFTLEYGIAANTAVLELMQRRHKPLLQEISRDREQKGKR